MILVVSVRKGEKFQKRISSGSSPKSNRPPRLKSTCFG
jgi:hypothetical protein